jgi:hypothetical protein
MLLFNGTSLEIRLGVLVGLSPTETETTFHQVFLYLA